MYRSSLSDLDLVGVVTLGETIIDLELRSIETGLKGVELALKNVFVLTRAAAPFLGTKTSKGVVSGIQQTPLGEANT